MTYVIAYLKHGELDTDEPFLCGELPTWGPLEEAIEYETLEAAQRMASWWGPGETIVLVIAKDEACKIIPSATPPLSLLAQALKHAPFDDEPYTDDERAAVADARRAERAT